MGGDPHFMGLPQFTGHVPHRGRWSVLIYGPASAYAALANGQHAPPFGPSLNPPHPALHCRWTVFSTLAALDVAKHLASELCDVHERAGSTVIQPSRPGPRGEGEERGNRGGVEKRGDPGEVPGALCQLREEEEEGDERRDRRAPPTASGQHGGVPADCSGGGGWALPDPEALGWDIRRGGSSLFPSEGERRRAYEACWQEGMFTRKEAADCFSGVQVTAWGMGQWLCVGGEGCVEGAA